MDVESRIGKREERRGKIYILRSQRQKTTKVKDMEENGMDKERKVKNLTNSRYGLLQML